MRYELYWVSKLRTLINSKRTDSAILKEYFIWAINEESKYNIRVKKQKTNKGDLNVF